AISQRIFKNWRFIDVFLFGFFAFFIQIVYYLLKVLFKFCAQNELLIFSDKKRGKLLVDFIIGGKYITKGQIVQILQIDTIGRACTYEFALQPNVKKEVHFEAMSSVGCKLSKQWAICIYPSSKYAPTVNFSFTIIVNHIGKETVL